MASGRRMKEFTHHWWKSAWRLLRILSCVTVSKLWLPSSSRPPTLLSFFLTLVHTYSAGVHSRSERADCAIPLSCASLFSHISQLLFLLFILPHFFFLSPSLSLSLWLFLLSILSFICFQIWFSLPLHLAFSFLQLTSSITQSIHPSTICPCFLFLLPPHFSLSLHLPSLYQPLFQTSIFSRPTLSPPHSLFQLLPPASSHHGWCV